MVTRPDYCNTEIIIILFRHKDFCKNEHKNINAFPNDIRNALFMWNRNYIYNRQFRPFKSVFYSIIQGFGNICALKPSCLLASIVNALL